jgi:hypothetical protein
MANLFFVFSLFHPSTTTIKRKGLLQKIKETAVGIACQESSDFREPILEQIYTD